VLPLRGGVRIVASGRIRVLEPTEPTFDPPAEFRIDDYLGRSFAVLRGDEGEHHRVRLHFTGASVKYVRERAWHPSQVLVPQTMTPTGVERSRPPTTLR
jgi:hypothetical protein